MLNRWWKKDDVVDGPEEEAASPRFDLQTGQAPAIAPAGVVTPQLSHTAYVLFADLIYDRFHERVMQTGNPVYQDDELEILLTEAETSVRAASPVSILPGSEAHNRAQRAELDRSLEVQDQKLTVAELQVEHAESRLALAEVEVPKPGAARATKLWLLVLAGIAGVALALTMAYSVDSIFFYSVATELLKGEGKQFIAQVAAGAGLVVSSSIAILFVFGATFITMVTVGSKSVWPKLGLFVIELLFVGAFANLRNVALNSNSIAAAVTTALWELCAILALNVVAWAAGSALRKLSETRLTHAAATRLAEHRHQHFVEAQAELLSRENSLLAQQVANQRHAENRAVLARNIEMARATTHSAYQDAKTQLHGRYVSPPMPSLDPASLGISEPAAVGAPPATAMVQ